MTTRTIATSGETTIRLAICKENRLGEYVLSRVGHAAQADEMLIIKNRMDWRREESKSATSHSVMTRGNISRKSISSRLKAQTKVLIEEVTSRSSANYKVLQNGKTEGATRRGMTREDTKAESARQRVGATGTV